MTFCIYFFLKAFYNLDINQIIIKTVFLYGLIDQLIYIKILKKIKIKLNKNMVYKLLKALYSLK